MSRFCRNYPLFQEWPAFPEVHGSGDQPWHLTMERMGRPEIGRLEQARTRRIEAWLARGGHVAASSTRAARAIAAAYHAQRIDEGQLAWTTPAIFAWDEGLRERWLESSGDGRLLLTPLQEQALWKRVIRGRPAVEGVLPLD